MTDSPFIAVVVCTHNRADRLGPCLNSLVAQQLAPKAFEVVLVNDGSTDDTNAVAAAFAPRLPQMRVIDQANAGLGAARERGWRATTAPIVAFLDDDAEAPPEWLEIALDYFAHHADRVAALGGPTRGRWETPRPAWLDDRLALWLTVWSPHDTVRESATEHLFVGANMIFRREALAEAGGFNPNLGRRGRTLLSHEESDLWSRVTRTGRIAAYDPRLWVWHYVPAERCRRAWFWRRIYWEGISLTRAQRDATVTRPGRALVLVLRALTSALFLRQLLQPWTWCRSAHGWFHLAYSLGCAREWLRAAKTL